MSHQRPAEFDEAVVATVEQLDRALLKLCHSTESLRELKQETVLRALLHWKSFRPGTNMAGWLWTIARNTYYNEHRASARSKDRVDAHEAEFWLKDHHVRDPLWTFENQQLLAVIDRLPPKFREVAHAFILDTSYTVIAQRLGIKEGTVKSRISRMLKLTAELTGTRMKRGPHRLGGGAFGVPRKRGVNGKQR